MFYQTISILGALLVLAAFFGNQLQKMSRESLWYQLLNFLGGGALFATAVVSRQYGFILMEGAWTALSLWGLLTLRSKKG